MEDGGRETKGEWRWDVEWRIKGNGKGRWNGEGGELRRRRNGEGGMEKICEMEKKGEWKREVEWRRRGNGDGR